MRTVQEKLCESNYLAKNQKLSLIFDLWSIGHIAIYFFIAKYFLKSFTVFKALIVYVVIAYLWEFLERVLEEYDHKNNKIFFTEKECWWNRYVGDVLAGLTGFSLGYFL